MIFTKDINKFSQKITNIVTKREKFQLLINALNEIYPDKYDIQLDISKFIAAYEKYNYANISDYISKEFLHFDIIIHYPEIIITNGHNKHKITDLYVRLNTRSRNTDMFIHTWIYGRRSSKTLEEIYSGYEHSHLLGAPYYTYFEKFCTGSGPINNIIGNSCDFSTVEEWKYLLLVLDNYLKWESISGVPYRRIDNIYSTEVSSSIDSSYVNYLIKNIKLKNLNFKISDSDITIIPDENIETILFPIIKDNGWQSLLCYKTQEGKYVSKNKTNLENKYKYLDGKQLNFIFKGEEIKFKILNTENINDYEFNSPNPYFTEAVCRELSKLLTKKHITSSRVTKENKIKDTTECSTADTLLV